MLILSFDCWSKIESSCSTFFSNWRNYLIWMGKYSKVKGLSNILKTATAMRKSCGWMSRNGCSIITWSLRAFVNTHLPSCHRITYSGCGILLRGFVDMAAKVPLKTPHFNDAIIMLEQEIFWLCHIGVNHWKNEFYIKIGSIYLARFECNYNLLNVQIRPRKR